jgi:multicomponent Na+:H+ antiporter subunit F
MTIAVFVLLLGAALCFGFRLARGPSIADRVLALDGLLITGVAAIATEAARSGDGSFLPVAVIVSLVGFVSTAIIARYMEGRDA